MIFFTQEFLMPPNRCAAPLAFWLGVQVYMLVLEGLLIELRERMRADPFWQANRRL